MFRTINAIHQVYKIKIIVWRWKKKIMEYMYLSTLRYVPEVQPYPKLHV